MPLPWPPPSPRPPCALWSRPTATATATSRRPRPPWGAAPPGGRGAGGRGGAARGGAPPALAAELARRVARTPLHLQGIWSHFAVAEEDPAFTAAQLRVLQTVLAALAAEGLRPELVHAANTAGGLAYPDARLDLVRAGIGVVGLRPGPQVAPEAVART